MNIPSSWLADNAAKEKTGAITSLESYCKELTFSENVRNFKFKPNLKSGFSNVSTGQIYVYAYVAVGSTITISTPSVSVTLTASATPSTGEFWTLASAPATLTAEYLSMVAESIADTLSQILYFNNNFIITSGVTYFVTLEAKEFGSDYSLSITSSSSVSLPVSSVPGTSKYLSQSQIDYTCFAELYAANGQFGAVIQKSGSQKIDDYFIDSATNEANINLGVIGDYVDPILPIKKLTVSSDYFAMDRGATGLGVIVDTSDEYGNQRAVMKPYFLVYGDSYRFIENGQRKRFVKGVTPIRWVQLGAADTLRPYELSEYVFMPSTKSSFKWLTSCPDNKKVTYSSHEFLQTICKIPTMQVYFNIDLRVRFYDGTSYAESKTSFPALSLFGNLSFDVSPLALGLEAIETANSKLIDYYDIKLTWVNGGVSSYSEIKRYSFDRDCNEKNTQLIFLNEFGAWDSLSFRGEFIESPDRTTKEISRKIPFSANTDESISSELVVNIETNSELKRTVNSGLIGFEFSEWTNKLIDSSAVYIWNNELSAYESIVISEFDFSKISTDGNFNLVITYSRKSNTIKR